MQRCCSWLIGLMLAIGLIAAPATARSADRVLLVVSGHGADGGKTRPGFEMDELSQAYLILRDNGLTVDIASPRGGAIEADRYDPAKPYNAQFLADPVAKAKLTQTLPLSADMARRYGAIYVIGGKGPMFDLVDHPVLQPLIGAMADKGAVVAAVCHGPAALARVKRGDGQPLVAGRRVTGLSNAEEAMFGKKWSSQFPFLLESELTRLGARFSSAPMMLGHHVVDGRLITGQNPYSVGATSEAIVRALGRTPKPRTLWPDERSIALIATAMRDGTGRVAAELAANKAAHDVPLIAAWAFYYGQTAAKDAGKLRLSIALLEAVQPYVADPKLGEALRAFQAQLNAPSP